MIFDIPPGCYSGGPPALRKRETGMTYGQVKLDSADKSDKVSFPDAALSRELGENRFRQLVKILGEENAKAMLKKAEEGFKDNCALLRKLAEM